MALATLAASASAADAPAFKVSTARVAVDFVVRDKQGEMLRGLTSRDVDVYEDGVRQEIESLEFVEARPGPLAESLATPGSPRPLVAIVLDGLGHESRLAVEAALATRLGGAGASSPLVGLFAIDRGVRTLQPFTSDGEALRRALVTQSNSFAGGYSGFRERQDIRNAHAGLGDGSPQTSVVPAELAGEPECRLEGEDLTRRFKVLSSRMKESFDVLERDRRGDSTLNALLSFVDAFAAMPGRKAVLLFSEGLVLPSGALSSFRSLVAAANRGGVSVYAADAMGLRSLGASDETRRTLETLRTRLELVQSVAPGTRGPGAQEMGDSGLALMEKAEDALRLAPASGLGQLADQTGGLLFHGTNDLGSALVRIEEGLGAYYLLSYVPRNTALDGRFRSIQVKVKRPHGSVQSRQGYLALQTPLPSAVLDDEARALARLEGAELPTRVPVQLRTLQYPNDPALFVVPIVAEVRAGAFAAGEGHGSGQARRDFTILAVVRDDADRVLVKASQRYQLPSAGDDSVLFYREARLPPGTYTVEVVAQDSRSDRAGAARSRLRFEPPASGHLRASSLMVVGSAKRLEAGGASAPEPLRYEEVLLYPELGNVRPGRPIALFLTAWPGADRPDVDAHVEVLRDRHVIQEWSAGRYSARPDGRIQVASSIPGDALVPGDYELRVTLRDGRDAQTSSASLRVEP